MASNTFRICGISALLICSIPGAWAGSAREEFERLGLLGAYSIDCAKPASPANGYIVYRALDATRVQRDTMTSPTDRYHVSIAETAAINARNELIVTGSDQGKAISYTLRIDGIRMRVMAWTEAGVATVVDGVWTVQKYSMPWLTKCP